MKLTSITLNEYGPVKDFMFNPGGFDLIYGVNESGKTAIVEALSYYLFDRTRGLRYGKPESISIEGEISGRKFRLPSKKGEPAIPKGEFTSLLYVQASETALYKDETKSRFWDSVKLMMGRVGQKVSFAKLGEKVLEAAGMTAKGRWKENKQRTIGEKEERRKKLDEFLRELTKIEQMKRRYAEKNAQYQVLAGEMEALKAAKKYYEYKKARDLYKSYQDKKNELDGYKRYDQKYVDEWQKLDAEKKAKAAVSQKLKADEKVLPELENQLEQLARTKQLVEDIGLRAYLAGPNRPPRRPTMFYTLLAFLLGMAVLLLKYRFGYSMIFPVMLFIIGLILFFLHQYKLYRVRRFHLAQEEKLNDAQAVFPDIEMLSELPDRLLDLDGEYVRCQTKISEKKETRDDIGTAENMPMIDKRMEELRSITGTAELSQLKEKVDHKRDLTSEIEGIKAGIEAIMHDSNESVWKRLIDDKKCDPPTIAVDEAAFDDRLSKFDRLKEEMNADKHQILVFEESRNKVYNVSDAHQAYVELLKLRQEMEATELERRAALKAADILNEMSSELDDVIEDIMAGGETSVNKHFARVTDRYEQIKITDRDFVVIDKNGQEFKAEDLSSGAQDQLLLCFRMAAIKKLFPDGGFLILDDAFIFADWQRRRKLAELVREFSQQGNQVVYLTSDDHTRELFKEFGAKITEI